MQILGIRYLAAHPVEDLQCLARTKASARCPQAVDDPTSPAGTWRLLPATAPTGRPVLSGKADMAVYDLTSLPYAEQLRWHAQRCPRHALASSGTAITDWEPFDPLVHHEHIHTRLPDQAAPDHAPAAAPAGRCRYA